MLPTNTRDAIAQSIDNGVELLVENIRNGPSSSNGDHTFGRGWHDFYQETNRTAGAHATLEGFLLSKVPAIDRRLRRHNLKPDQHIFGEYLVPLFRRGQDDGWPPQKEDQRAEAEVTTTKLAKFAQCCYFANYPQKTVLGKAAIRTLASVDLSGALAIGHSIRANDISVNPPSSFAAAELLRARYLWAETDDDRLQLVKRAWDFLSPVNNTIKDNPWRLESIPWLKDALPIIHAVYTTCAGTLQRLEPGHHLRQSFSILLECVLKYDYFLMGDMVIETYSFRDQFAHKSRTDYVSFESTLYLLQTIFSGVGYSLYPTAVLDHIQPMLYAWRSAQLSGYCNDLLNPSSIPAQKNRFSYLASVLRTLAVAEESFSLAKTLINPNLPMFVNPIRFLDRGIVPDGRTAFLAIPFLDQPRLVRLGSRLRDECSRHGFKLYRTDDLKDPKLDIPQKIWRDIWRSSFVIAVCDGRNPNVYYEIGLAHAIGKPVFLCASTHDEFTFDVNGIQHCLHDDSDALERALNEFIQNLHTGTL